MEGSVSLGDRPPDQGEMVGKGPSLIRSNPTSCSAIEIVSEVLRFVIDRVAAPYEDKQDLSQMGLLQEKELPETREHSAKFVSDRLPGEENLNEDDASMTGQEKLNNANIKKSGVHSYCQTIRVECERTLSQPYFHGYRDKRTGLCYLNAIQQTSKNHEEVMATTIKCTRETQLCESRNQGLNTAREAWTQVNHHSILVDCRWDYTLCPKLYKDSKTWEDNRIKATIVIQKFTRRWIAKRKAKRLKINAQELSELYTALQKGFKSIDDRMCVLGFWKHPSSIQKQKFINVFPLTLIMHHTSI